MEEKLLKLLKLADSLNDKQDKVYAHISYSADYNKTLEIAIRRKKDFSYVEKCEIQLRKQSIISIDNIIELLTFYVNGGDIHE